MKIYKSEIVIAIMIVIAFILGAYVFPLLPEKMASHWNVSGEVDGYMPKFWGVFLMPMISVVLFALLIVFPRIDPKRKNIEKFRKYFDLFLIALFAFLTYLYILTLGWNFGVRFDMTAMLAPAFGGLFFVMGVLIRHAEPNWSIGIRTPWTMSDEKVWKKTHALGGRLFIYCAAIAALGYFFPGYAIWLMLAPILATAVYTIVYSYLEYRKMVKK